MQEPAFINLELAHKHRETGHEQFLERIDALVL